MIRRALLDADVDTRKAALDALGAFQATDAAGVSRLNRLALRDTDPAVRARAQAQLAGLLAPAQPEPDDVTDQAVLDAALAEVASAGEEAAGVSARAETCAQELSRAIASAARNEAALKGVEEKIRACLEVESAAGGVRGRAGSSGHGHWMPSSSSSRR